MRWRNAKPGKPALGYVDPVSDARICNNCGRHYWSTRSTAHYCSSRCRARYALWRSQCDLRGGATAEECPPDWHEAGDPDVW